MLRRPVLHVPAALLAAFVVAPALAPGSARGAPDEPNGPKAQSSPDTGAAWCPPWMAAFAAIEKQPVGMDVSDLDAFLDKQVKTKHRGGPSWKQMWDKNLLLMTPAHTVEVPAFAISKFEISNAQWERFLRERMDKLTTKGGETLESLATRFWDYDPDKERGAIQSGWQHILTTNSAVLLPVLNPNKDEKWDPQKERAAEAKLPAGLELSYSRYPIPVHWKGGQLRESERRRPVRSVSWEQCIDFCEWAGFHLPHEFEWERAARGDKGRWFPWGDEWDGTRAVWQGFNDAALASIEAAKKKGGEGAVQPMESSLPEPVDVDGFPQGTTPEGIHHLIGNVSEFVANRSTLYPGGKKVMNPYAGLAQMARGGNCEDKAEILLAADRNSEGPQGALLGSHVVGNNGLRVAAYPVAGADLAAPVSLEWADRNNIRSVANFQPLPPGIADLKKAAPYWGLALQNTAGYLERSLKDDDPDHVFVVGAARGVAFLPVKGFPNETVKGVADLTKHTDDVERPVFLGLLVGTSNVAFSVQTMQADGKPADTAVASKDPKHLALPDGEARIHTRADVGLMLVLEGEKVAVYAADDSVKGAKAYRKAPLGHLAQPAKIEADRESAPSSGKMDGTTAVLSARIPLLTKDGTPQKGAASLRVTIRVPVVPR